MALAGRLAEIKAHHFDSLSVARPLGRRVSSLVVVQQAAQAIGRKKLRQLG